MSLVTVALLALTIPSVIAGFRARRRPDATRSRPMTRGELATAFLLSAGTLFFAARAFVAVDILIIRVLLIATIPALLVGDVLMVLAYRNTRHVR